MEGMTDAHQTPEEPIDPGDEYRVSPNEPLPEIERAVPLREKPAEPEFDPRENQFSIREMRGLTFFVAVVFSAISTTMRFLPPEASPARYVGNIAAVLGFGALASMVVLAAIPSVRRIVTVGWWVLVVLYLLASVAAVFMTR